MKALVLGRGNGVFDEAERALDLAPFDVVVAVNDMIFLWPGYLDVACTLHPEKLHVWVGERVRRGMNRPQTWAHSNIGPRGNLPLPADHTISDWGGSSGLFAVRVALHQGCNRIVLAGVPMLASAAHIGDDKPWKSAPNFQRGWKRHLHEYREYTRSMSGWTKDLLGEPTEDWLAESA